MNTPTKILLTEEEYLAQEVKAEFKSEYHAGEVVAMAGAQLPHNIIVSNLIFLLRICLEEKSCLVLPSDLLLKLPECEKFVYPDVMIVCDEPVLDEQKQQGLDVLLNPEVVIEVTSASTALLDRSEKMNCYLKLVSLQQYVLVDSEKIDVTIFTKNEQGDWLMTHKDNPSEKVMIQDCELLLEKVYQRALDK